MNMNFTPYHSNNGHLAFDRSVTHESLDQCKVGAGGFGLGVGLGFHVPDYEAYGTDIEATDVLCGRGKTSFNHGTLVWTKTEAE
jgi:hypothetical protein